MVAAAGMFSLPLDYLRDMLANSSNFQTWTTTLNATAAKARTHVIGAADTATLPLAVVGWASFERESTSGGSRNFFEGGGPIALLFVAAAGADTEENEGFTFVNDIGGILADVEALAGQAGYLDIKRISLEEIWRTEPDEDRAQTDDDQWHAQFMIEFMSAGDA